MLDARKLSTLQAGRFDAVYASHILEHFFDHELPSVLLGMRHVVKRDGWVEIRVPDVGQAVKAMADGRDLDFILYHSPTGPISVADMLWGSRKYAMYQQGDFMTHKTGFTERTLQVALNLSDYRPSVIEVRRWELRALAFTSEPSAETRAMLGVEHGK